MHEASCIRAIALAVVTIVSASAIAAPAGVEQWEPVPTATRSKVYSIRDTSVVARRQDVIFGPHGIVNVDLAGLMTDFGLDQGKVALSGAFEVDVERSGRSGWVVLQQWYTQADGSRVRVESGRIAAHADPAGMVDYLEWGGYEDPVTAVHRQSTETEGRGLMAAAFESALGELGDDVLGVAGIEPLYIQHKAGLIAVWAADVYSRNDATGRRAIERVVIRTEDDQRWTVLRRAPLQQESEPQVDPNADWDQIWADRVTAVFAPAGSCVPRLDRTVEDAQGVARTRHEGDLAVGDASIDTTFDALGESAETLRTLYGWCDDRPVLARVNIRGNTSYYQLTTRQLELGAGDGVSETSNGADRDVVYHESVHRVIHNTTGFGRVDVDGDGEGDLFYDTARALNESFSDIFAAIMDIYRNGRQPRAETWKMFEDSYIAGDAMRYLDRPADNRERGVDHFDTRLAPCATATDPCSNHQKGGLSSLAFYLASEGGRHPRLSMVESGRLQMEGVGWEDAGRIYFDLLDTRLGAVDENWFDLRVHVTELAAQRFGPHSRQLIAMCKAFDIVGIWGTGKLRCAAVPGLVTGITVSPRCDEHDVSWNPVPGATRYVPYAVAPGAGLESAAELASTTGLSTTYRNPGTGAAANRNIYVSACNAQTCGPISIDYDAAEARPTGSACQ